MPQIFPQPLKDFPILHRFITVYILKYMSEVKNKFPDVFKELEKYKVSGYCKCNECGTFYLTAPKAVNIFSFYENKYESFSMHNLEGTLFIPKTYTNPDTLKVDPFTIDFEVVGGDYDINLYPYAKELVNDIRDTSDKEAWRQVNMFFQGKKEKPIHQVIVD